jgi:hypothetical protein
MYEFCLSYLWIFYWSNTRQGTQESKMFCWYLSHRNVKPLIAQLMRIHIVTPKAPIHVTLNPRVQPAPSPCPVFVTGCEQPMKLSQSAYWVLRLPYPFSMQNMSQNLLTSQHWLSRDTCSNTLHFCFHFGWWHYVMACKCFWKSMAMSVEWSTCHPKIKTNYCLYS